MVVIKVGLTTKNGRIQALKLSGTLFSTKCLFIFITVSYGILNKIIVLVLGEFNLDRNNLVRPLDNLP
jgi:hypothetical protein